MKRSFNFFSATAQLIECILRTMFELVLGKVTSPSRSIVCSFTPIGLWQPNILFAVGLMYVRIFDLKSSSVFELRMLESNLPHSSMFDGKYEFLKNWCFTLIWGILVLYGQFDCGITSKRYCEHWFLYTLKKKT